MTLALKLITPPEVEPIALSEIQNFLRIDNEADVTILTDMISVARKRAESITGRQLITATWELRLDHFPGGRVWNPGRHYFSRYYDNLALKLPCPPLQSITSLKYLDSSGVEQTLIEDSDFIVDTYSNPARITAAYGTYWPLTYPEINAVRIRFVCGYGDADTDVPEPIRNWMKAFIGAMYENRELVAANYSTVNLVNMDFLDGLLDEYKVWSL